MISRPSTRPVRAVVLGDLVTDLVLLPGRSLRRGTDVAGRVALRQGGSAATTARVLAVCGASAAFVTAIGDDGAGRALVAFLEGRGVEVHAVTIRGAMTGRLGVLVEASGERTFVADRGAILKLRPRHLRATWFRGADVLHLPGYSLFGEGLAEAGERAAAMAREAGARVSVDLSSAGFLEDFGVDSVLARVRRIGPDIVFANEAERAAAAGAARERLLDLAPLVVLKQGSGGASVLRRGIGDPLVVASPPAEVADSTGAGDAFDAGFLASWLAAGHGASAAELVRAVRAGHRAARREVAGRRTEFDLGVLTVRRGG